MLTSKTISVKTIIAKLYRDLKLKEEEDFMDFIEWCAEALDFIHVYPQYTNESTTLKIKNFKSELPCNFISLVSINYEGLSLSYSTNIFGPLDTTKTSQYLTPYSFNQDKINNVLLLKPTANRLGLKDSFSIKNGYIITSFKEGEIDINYKAIPIDEEGYPLIPDHQSFKEALFWYCNYKFLYSKALTNQVHAQFYTDAYEKWQFYCNQAGAEALMPDLITLENIKKSYLTLQNRPNLFNNFFETLNKNY